MRTGRQYQEYLETSLATVSYIIEHPYKASFKFYLPGFISRRTEGTKNTTIFNLMTQLCKMGFHEHVHHLQFILNHPQFNDEEKLKIFLEYQYRLFDEAAIAVAADGSSEQHSKSLKKLKKLIHDFARENDFECRLFNLNSLKQKLLRQKDQHAKFQEEFFEVKSNLREVMSQIAAGDDTDKTRKKQAELKYRSDELHAALLQFNVLEIERQLVLVEALQENDRIYAYISDETIKPVRSSEQYAADKTAKFRLNMVSLGISLVVAVGEGMVAAVFAAAAWPLLLAILVVGIPAFICNFYLFRGDSYQILKDIYFGNIWRKPNGQSLTTLEKGFVASSLIFSLGAAAAFGFLSFGSGMTGFAAIFAAIGIAANPIGLAVLAGFVALVTTVALFTVFAYMTVNWVRNGGPGKLKKGILNLRVDFVNYWKHPHWDTLSFGQKCVHVAIKILKAFLKILFFALAVALVVLVNVATFGLFKHKAATIFHATLKLGLKLSNILAYVIVVGIGGIVNSLFYAKSSMSVLTAIKTGLVNLVLAIAHPKQTVRSIKRGWAAMKENKVATVHRVITAIKRCFLFSCVAMNSYGQGSGVRHDSTALKWAHTVLPVSVKTNGYLNMGALAAGSGGANLMAAHDATAQPDNLGHGHRTAEVARLSVSSRRSPTRTAGRTSSYEASSRHRLFSDFTTRAESADVEPTLRRTSDSVVDFSRAGNPYSLTGSGEIPRARSFDNLLDDDETDAVLSS